MVCDRPSRAVAHRLTSHRPYPKDRAQKTTAKTAIKQLASELSRRHNRSVLVSDRLRRMAVNFSPLLLQPRLGLRPPEATSFPGRKHRCFRGSLVNCLKKTAYFIRHKKQKPPTLS
jgi:hypothetical protein